MSRSPERWQRLATRIRRALTGVACFCDSATSVADSGSSGLLMALSKPSLSSVNINACSLPRVTAT